MKIKAIPTATLLALSVLIGCVAPQGPLLEEQAAQAKLERDVAECLTKAKEMDEDFSATCGSVSVTRVGNEVTIGNAQ
jgi:hypothetical protein